jgi:hypothetical protein
VAGLGWAGDTIFFLESQSDGLHHLLFRRNLRQLLLVALKASSRPLHLPIIPQFLDHRDVVKPSEAIDAS